MLGDWSGNPCRIATLGVYDNALLNERLGIQHYFLQFTSYLLSLLNVHRLCVFYIFYSCLFCILIVII